MKSNIISSLLLTAFLGSVLFLGVSVAQLSSSFSLNTTGTTAIISDLFNVTPNSINWGTVALGVPVSRQMVIANTQNFPLTMSMTYGSEIPVGIVKSLIWNCSGYTILAKSSVTANVPLTLVDDMTISNSTFSLAIVVTGTA